MTVTTDHQITVYDRAAETIRDMERQVTVALNLWGSRQFAAYNEQAIAMSTSLLRCLTHVLIGMADISSVARDGELSLYVVSNIHMGVIFHAKGGPDAPEEGDEEGLYLGITAPRMGRYCMVVTDGEVTPAGFRRYDTIQYCGKPIYRGEPTCDHGDDVVIMSLPVLGEWSTHS